MEKPTLLILAAGMGSRFGGLKQVMGFGPNGEALIDYALFDARQAGFERAVFVVRPGIEQLISQRVRDSVNSEMLIDFAYQDLHDLPAGFACPAGREKPWGTGHAVFAARTKLSGAFGVIGSDDFFGRDAFFQLYSLLSSPQNTNDLGLVAYRLENTLSEHGAVSRGVCEVAGGFLQSVTERTRIIRDGESIYYEDDGKRTPLCGDTLVSLNVWGMSAGIFELMESDLTRFLSEDGDALKREYYLPAFVDRLVREGKARVRVTSAQSRWHGVTHASDGDALKLALKEMHEQGIYPALV